MSGDSALISSVLSMQVRPLDPVVIEARSAEMTMEGKAHPGR
jgi:hypothetical protein